MKKGGSEFPLIMISLLPLMAVIAFFALLICARYALYFPLTLHVF